MSKISQPAPANLYIYGYQHIQINKYNKMNRMCALQHVDYIYCNYTPKPTYRVAQINLIFIMNPLHNQMPQVLFQDHLG